MSGKVGNISIPADSRSQVSEFLNNWSNERSTNRRYQMQSDKEDRRFQLQLARQNMLDQRYQNERAEAKQDKIDALNASIEASSVLPFEYESLTEEEVLVDKLDSNTEKPIAMDLYDTEKMNEALVQNPNMFDPKKIEKLKEIQLNRKNLEIEAAVNDINTNPMYKNQYEKNEAKREWMAQNGYDKQLEDEGGTLDSAYNAIGSASTSILDTIVGGATELAVGASDAKEGRKIGQRRKDFVKSANENEFKSNDPIDFLNSKVAELNKNRETNANIKSRNEKMAEDEATRVKKIVDSFKTGKTFNQKEKKTVTTPIARKKVVGGVMNEAAKRIRAVLADKTKTLIQKTKKIEAIAAQRDKTLSTYSTERKAFDENNKWRNREDYKAKIDLNKMKKKQDLQVLAKKKEELRKQNTPKAKADLKKVLAQIEKIKND